MMNSVLENFTILQVHTHAEEEGAGRFYGYMQAPIQG